MAINESHWPKVGVPSGPEDITAEWFTNVFHTRGIIGSNISIISVDSKQIGEGRGYANVSRPPKTSTRTLALTLCSVA